MKLIHSQIMDKTTANDMTHAEVNEMVVALERESWRTRFRRAPLT